MSQVLSKIHSVDLRAAKLEDLGEHGNYIQRQVETWTKQYRAMETHVIPAMERLIEWLPLHFPESQKTAVVHGDFRYCLADSTALEHIPGSREGGRM